MLLLYCLVFSGLCQGCHSALNFPYTGRHTISAYNMVCLMSIRTNPYILPWGVLNSSESARNFHRPYWTLPQQVEKNLHRDVEGSEDQQAEKQGLPGQTASDVSM